MTSKATDILHSLMLRCEGWVGHCVWCGIDIVAVGLIPKWVPHYQRTHDHRVMLMINGIEYLMEAASVDHYFERNSGGRSEPRNILPSCRRCNTRRSI